MNKHLVVLLAYDQLCTFEYGCAAEVFALKRPELAPNLKSEWYDFAVHCVDRGVYLKAAGGLEFKAPYRPHLLALADTIIIPGWKSLDAQPSAALIKALRAAHKRGCRIATICSGAFVLAASGLLNGLRVTTHWRYVDALVRQYPDLTVMPNDLYVDEGLILTSAGSAAGLDMMLHMVNLDHGTQVANLVAQRLVLPLHREGGQAQFISRPVTGLDQHRLSSLMEWIRTRLHERLSVAQMAAKAAMTTRTLQRAFIDSTGLSPLHWLTQERIYFAKTLLEQSQESEVNLAQRAGFGSLQTFRYHFKARVGVSPKNYRSTFSAV
jgi:AraC family transcriptional regulator, transcriptional activator FtrA